MRNAFALCAAIMFAACAPAAAPTAPGAGATSAPSTALAITPPSPVEVTIAQGVDVILFGAEYIARARYFAEEGIVAKPVLLSTSVLPAILSGDAQFAMTVMGTGIRAAEQGQSVVGLIAFTNEYGNNVVMRSDVAQRLGITYASSEEAKVRALKGLKIGITGPGGGADQLARYLLRKYKLDPERDAELVAAKDNVAALAAKQLDAYVFPSPDTETSVARGEAIWLFKTASGDIKDLSPMTYQVLWAKREYVDKNPDIVRRVVRAITKGALLIKQKPDEAKVLVQSFFPKIEPAVFDAAWSTNLPSFTDPAMSRRGFEANLSFQTVLGTPAKVTYEQVVIPTFVDEAKTAVGYR